MGMESLSSGKGSPLGFDISYWWLGGVGGDVDSVHLVVGVWPCCWCCPVVGVYLVGVYLVVGVYHDVYGP